MSSNAMRQSKYLLGEAMKLSAQKTTTVTAANASGKKFGQGKRFAALVGAAGVGAGFYVNTHLDDFPGVKKLVGKMDETQLSSASSAKTLVKSVHVPEAGNPPVVVEKPILGRLAESGDEVIKEPAVVHKEVAEEGAEQQTDLPTAVDSSSNEPLESNDGFTHGQMNILAKDDEVTIEQNEVSGEEESLPAVKGSGEEDTQVAQNGNDRVSVEEREIIPAVITLEGGPPEKEEEEEEEEPVDLDTREGVMELQRRQCRGLSAEELIKKIVDLTGRRFDEAAQVAKEIEGVEAEAEEKARAHYEEELNIVTDQMADMKLDYLERIDSIMADHAGDIASIKGEVAALEVALDSINEDKEAAMHVAFDSQTALSLSMDLMHDEGDVRGVIEELTKLPSIRPETHKAVLGTLPSPLPPVYSAGVLKVRFERQLPRMVTSAFMPEKSSMMGTVMARIFASLYRLDRNDADELRAEGAQDAPEEFYRSSLLPFTDPTSKNLNSITRAARCMDRGDLVGAVRHLRATSGKARETIDEWLSEAVTTLEVWQAVDVIRGDFDSVIASHL
ncbi:hypothetical protein Pmar_PMAR009859 [Perkinsus marinus ATCC 50983]|uniref:MICOS complex subunit MIC60 n=1 Tax=Perkinsus marinus (strain ATCC 50983 / TXsc) TaxID=423536 RepID=C5KV98_PERM5|nr:hypothetical protein Pmar_PMAR009859 [Perkinsus marinus ATCC 50983]EER11644.1 hypothetical protein Pmar_PMAR009859 [Perkinsus marinus ATCC 50983]|eukprot:XP_002779849.1 hypothetical protein Pmar_PMAR009859 [Perkinsus marinus ATCC 50983]